MSPRHYLLLLACFVGGVIAGRTARSDQPLPVEPHALVTTPKPRAQIPDAPPRRALGGSALAPVPPARKAPTAHEALVLQNPAGHAALQRAVSAGLRPLFPALQQCLVADDLVGLMSLALDIDAVSEAETETVVVHSVRFDEVADGSPVSPAGRDCLNTVLSQPVEAEAGGMALPDFDGRLVVRIAFELGIPEDVVAETGGPE